MLNALHMQTRETFEAFRLGEIQDGNVHAFLLRFTHTSDLGFQLWKWLKFKDGWKRGHLFKSGDIDKLSSLLGQLEEGKPPPEPGSAPALMTFDLREYVPNHLVSVSESGMVRTCISDPRLPKPAAPFFTFRRIMDGQTATANWFYASDMDDVLQGLQSARSWLDEYGRQ